jgi:hypothetical protein
MNERIKQLVEQATTYIEPTSNSDDGWIFDKEKFAQLIVKECVGVVEGGSFLHDQAPTAVFARECSAAIKRHFGEDSSIRVGGRVKVVSGFNVGARGTVSYIEPTGRLWVRRDGASTDVFYTPNEVVGIAQ